MSLSPTPGARSRSRRAFVTFAALVVALGVALPVALGGATASSAVTNYAKFVGVKPGKANPKLKPVVIGLVNLQGGQVQVGPLWTPAVETTVKYANAELRGAGGHPIILKECFIKTSEEEGTRCGQAMANDKRVSVVLWGASSSATSRSTPPSVRSPSSAGCSSTRSTRRPRQAFTVSSVVTRPS